MDISIKKLKRTSGSINTFNFLLLYQYAEIGLLNELKKVGSLEIWKIIPYKMQCYYYNDLFKKWISFVIFLNIVYPLCRTFEFPKLKLTV